MRSSIFLFACIFSLVGAAPAWADLELCEALLLQSGVSVEGVNAIHEAQGKFKFAALVRMRVGEPQTIILAGETHLKSGAAYRAGLNLVENFPNAAHEGVSVAEGGLATKVIMYSIAPMYALARKLGFKGSNIITIRERQARENESVAAATEIIKQLGREGVALLDWTPEFEKLVADKARTFTEPGVPFALTTADILLAVRRALGFSAPPLYRSVWLEKGHVSPTLEKVAMFRIPAVLAVLGLDALVTQSNFARHLNPEALAMIQGTLAYAPLYFFAGILGVTPFAHERWFQKLFPLDVALLSARNETMVQNLMEAMDQNGPRNILVIVGRGHVRGLSVLLERKGFNPINL